MKKRNVVKRNTCLGRVVTYVGWVVLSLMISGVALAEDDEDKDKPKLVSKVTTDSAALEMSKMSESVDPSSPLAPFLSGVTKITKEEDEKRARIGPKEAVSLALEGKEELLGTDKEITWKITKGPGVLANLKSAGGEVTGKNVTLRVKGSVYSKTNISGVVTFKTGSIPFGYTVVVPESISVVCVVPEQVCGVYQVQYNDKGELMMVEGGMSMYLVGVGGKLVLQYNPTDVRLTGVKIIEKDEGTKIYPDEGYHYSEAGSHTGCGSGFVGVIEMMNMGTDTVMSLIPLEKMKNLAQSGKLPQKWSWTCEWRMYTGQKDHKQYDGDSSAYGPIIRTTDQIFELYSLGNGHFGGSITKFGCKMKSNTND